MPFLYSASVRNSRILCPLSPMGDSLESTSNIIICLTSGSKCSSAMMSCPSSFWALDSCRATAIISLNIHFGASAGADQFCCNHSRHKEKSCILLTGAVVVQHGIMFFPVTHLIFDYPSPVKKKIGYKMAFLQFIPDRNCPTLETGTKPCCKFFHGADPFTGVYRIADTIYAEIRSTEICVVAKHHIIKKTRTSACTNALVCH